MPHPHHPAQGGPHRAAWNREEARKPRRALPATGRVANLLKPAVSPMRTDAPPPRSLHSESRAVGSLTILGLAAVLCAAGIVFALVVILKHS